MKNIYQNFIKNEEGMAVVIFAILLPIFLLCLTLTLDATSGLATKTRVSAVQDAVGLSYSTATTEMLEANNISREDYALRFSALNLDDDYQIVIRPDDKNVVISTNITNPNANKPVFAKAAGVSDEAFGTGKAAKISQQQKSASTAPTLLSLVLDGSGSMSGQKIQDLKIAVQDLVDDILKNYSGNDFWISQVVYDTGVKTSRNFSNVYLTVRNWAADIKAQGGTCGSCGLGQAKTNTDSKISADPARYGKFAKTIIFMSDGQMMQGDKQLNICTTLKNDGYIIHSIGFGSGANENTMRKCASPGKYHHANDGKELIEIFRAVTTQIIRTRIIE